MYKLIALAPSASAAKPSIAELVAQKSAPLEALFKEGVLSHKQFTTIKDQMGVDALFARHRQPGERIIGFMGSARTLDTDAEFKAIQTLAQRFGNQGYSILTGAGPGLMEAASQGGKEAGAKVYGIRIHLPFEQHVSSAIDPDYLVYCDNFEPRFQGLIYNADAIIAGAGGLGTTEEINYAITEMQTGKMPLKPVILFGDMFDDFVAMMNKMKDRHMISENDLSLVNQAASIADAQHIVNQFFRHFDKLEFGDKPNQLIIHLNKPISERFTELLPANARFMAAFAAAENGEPLCQVRNDGSRSSVVLNANIRNIGVVRMLIDYINNQPEQKGEIVPGTDFWRTFTEKMMAAIQKDIKPVDPAALTFFEIAKQGLHRNKARL